MRLVIDYRLAGYSMRGMAKYCISMTNELLKSPRMSAFDIILYVDKKCKKELLPNSVEYRVLPTRNFVFGEQILLPYFLYRDKIDILWSPHNTFPLIKIPSVKMYATWHDLVVMDKRMKCNTLLSFLIRSYYNLIMRYGWKNLDMVCTVSEFSKKEILNKFHFKNILITPNCIDDFIKSIDIELKNKNYYREDFFFTVSGEFWYKNLDFLFDWFRSNRKFTLKVAGLKPNSLFYNNCPENIQILPYNIPLEKIIEYYCRCRAFLFVSKYEGFGIPILEAMACNCRLIVSNVASIPEVCGDNGLYIDPYDVNTFSEAMNKIDDFEIDKNKRLHQIEKFSNWEKSANTLIDALLGDKLE